MQLHVLLTPGICLALLCGARAHTQIDAPIPLGYEMRRWLPLARFDPDECRPQLASFAAWLKEPPWNIVVSLLHAGAPEPTGKCLTVL